jgi:hypothetical protein
MPIDYRYMRPRGRAETGIRRSSSHKYCMDTRACNKRDFEHRSAGGQPNCFFKLFFLLTKDTPPCYVGTNGPVSGRHSQMMDQLQTDPRLRVPLRTQDLNSRQHSPVELMRENQFGRIENMPIRDGQPILDSTVNVVRVARSGGDSLAIKLIAGDDFER